MNDEHRDAIRKANQRRGFVCRKCGSPSTDVVDGSRCEGMPGLNYRQCLACGFAYPLTKRPSRRTPKL